MLLVNLLIRPSGNCCHSLSNATTKSIKLCTGGSLVHTRRQMKFQICSVRKYSQTPDQTRNNKPNSPIRPVSSVYTVVKTRFPFTTHRSRSSKSYYATAPTSRQLWIDGLQTGCVTPNNRYSA